MNKNGTYKAILYSRVSTTHDDQAESIDNQILLAQNYLAKHPNIILAEPLDKYSEKISAKTDVRPKYRELCERLARGDIRYLMIKDLKRLSRSVETTYAFLNLMKQYGFEIIQLSTGSIIDSKAFEEVEGNLLIGIEALFAQNMVLTQSRYGRTTQKVRCENKKLTYKDSTLFGYKWDPQRKDIIIDPEKAEVIKELYTRYAIRSQSILELREYLSSIGYNYSQVTVAKWLQEGKYVGDWTINRKGSILGIGQGAKTRRFRRESWEWVHIERPDLAIVDKEVFALAQEIRLSRVHKYEIDGQEKMIGAFNGAHLFSGKVYCAECGCTFQHKWGNREKTRSVYRDSFRKKAGDATKKCSNKYYRQISEDELKEIVVSAITVLNIKGAVSIEKMIEAISVAMRSTDRNDKKQIEEQMLKRLEKEAKEISGAFVDATPAMRQRLNRQLEETEEKIEASQRRLEKLNNRSANEEELRQRLSVIQKQLSGWFDVTKGSLNKKMVEKLVSRIIVHKDGKIEVSLLLGNLLNYQLEGEKSKKKKNQNTLQLMFPSEKMMNENIMKVLQDVEREEQQKAIINVMNFSRNTKKNGRKTVMVNLDTQ